MNLLEVKDICKTYGSGETAVHALKNISFSVPKGEYVAIVGESGSGKSTLLNMIGALDTPTSGKVFIDGKDIVSMNDRKLTVFRRRNIGFIFQDFGLIESETIINNLKIVKKIKKMPHKEKRIKEVLNSLQLDMDLNRKVYELSGGEQQRLAIAKIILKDPDLILADEPTASLDLGNKEIILNLLKQFSTEGKTVIIVTHDKDTIEIADNKIDLSKVKEGTVYE